MSDVIIYDGICGLCTRSVRFILAHETSTSLRFAAIQSPAGERLLREFGFEPSDVNTFVLIEREKSYTKSEAALRIVRYLHRPWSWLRFLRILPTPVRDWGYDLVARNRYEWFGMLNSCMTPLPGSTDRFIYD